jgi:hypothetical protein
MADVIRSCDLAGLKSNRSRWFKVHGGVTDHGKGILSFLECFGAIGRGHYLIRLAQ